MADTSREWWPSPEGGNDTQQGLSQFSFSRAFVKVGLNLKCASCIKYESGSNTCIVGAQPETCGKLYEPTAGAGCKWEGPFPGGRIVSEPDTSAHVGVGDARTLKSEREWQTLCAERDKGMTETDRFLAQPSITPRVRGDGNDGLVKSWYGNNVEVEVSKQNNLTDDEAKEYAQCKIDDCLEDCYRIVCNSFRWRCPVCSKLDGAPVAVSGPCIMPGSVEDASCICRNVPLAAVAQTAYNRLQSTLGYDKNMLRGWRVLKPSLALILGRLAFLKPAFDALQR